MFSFKVKNNKNNRSNKLKNIPLVLLVGALCACFGGGASYFNWLVMTTVMYNVMVNNFIQTLGTFNVSNKYAKKWKIFLYLASIFIAYFVYTWLKYDGNIRKGSLRHIEYKDSFGYSLLLLPILVALFNYFGIPVSIAFLSIPLFISGEIVKAMIAKAFLNYFLAFAISFIFWNILYVEFKKILKKKDNHKFWMIVEYISIGILWCCWLNTCVSSFMVFLPPKLDLKHLLLLLVIGTIIISIITILRSNDKMEQIIEEKTDVNNIMFSVLFNVLHSVVLVVLKLNSEVPIATSWIFTGLLDGRELGIVTKKSNSFSDQKYKLCLKKIVRDLCFNTIGIIISLLFVRIIKMWSSYGI